MTERQLLADVRPAHVKHILRKLRAANRSEAVSLYMRSAREEEFRAIREPVG